MLGFAVHGHSEALAVTDEVFEEDVIVGVRMVIRYEVGVNPSGTRVTHKLTAQLPGGLSGRILSLFLRPRLRALQRGVLERLAVKPGPPPPEPSPPSSPSGPGARRSPPDRSSP
jgi:hypothetical protein